MKYVVTTFTTVTIKMYLLSATSPQICFFLNKIFYFSELKITSIGNIPAFLQALFPLFPF